MKRSDRKEKRGISTIVAVVLLLLIVVAAVVILWTSILPLLKSNVQQASSIGEMTDFSIVEGGYTAYFPEKERAIVQIKSGPDNSTAVELQVMFYISGSSIEYRIPPPTRDDTLPMSNEARVYWFNLSGMGVPEKVSVAPIYKRGNSLVVGNIISMVSLPSKKLSLTAEEIDELEKKVVNGGGGGGSSSPGDVDPCANGACDIIDNYNYTRLNIPSNSGFISPYSMIPMPQKIGFQNYSLTGFKKTNIDSSWQIVADLSDLDDSFSANYLKNKTLDKTSNRLSLDVVDIASVSNFDKKIVIGNPNLNSKIDSIAASKGININSLLSKGYNQGYVLLIEPNQITILANSTTGTFYGIVSLIWLLNYNSSLSASVLPNLKIIDWPDLEIRAYEGKVIFGLDVSETKIDNRKTALDFLAMYKINLYGDTNEEIYSFSDSNYVNAELEIKDYADKRHMFSSITSSPQIQLTFFDKNLLEGNWAKDMPMQFNSSDVLVSNESEVYLNNSGFENDSDGNSLADYWRIMINQTQDPQNYWKRDCTQAYSGICSMKLTITKDISGSSSYFYPGKKDSSGMINYYNITRNNRLYYMSFWAKKSDVNPANSVSVSAVLDYNSNSGTTYVTGSDNQWKKYGFIFSTANNESMFYTSIASYSPQTSSLEFWIDDIQITDVTNKLVNVIKTDSTSIEVWNLAKTKKYTEGIDYSVSETGKFNVSYPIDGKKTTVRRINSGSIGFKESVLVSYDFAGNFQQEGSPDSYSFADPLTIKYFDTLIINRTMKIINPQFINLYLDDEVRGFNRDSRSKKLSLKNYQMLAKSIKDMNDLVHSYNPNTKVIIWDDMVNPYHNGGVENYQIRYGGQPGKTQYALDLIPRDMILLTWWYDSNDYNMKMTKSPNLLNSLGFTSMGSSWDSVENIREWSYLAYKNNLYGLWGNTFYDRVSGTIPLANYSWNTLKSSLSFSISNIAFCDQNPEKFTLQNDSVNCGTCGNVCYYPKAYSSCVNSECRFDGCLEGFNNLDGNLDNGCESS